MFKCKDLNGDEYIKLWNMTKRKNRKREGRSECGIPLFFLTRLFNNFTSGDEDKSPRRLIKVLLGGSNVYSACNGYLTSVS
ncbi:hypothetical protein BpHYR1_000179 [Brachionus plicatilis]|uniref:Uncharacterized protein n=1 Tax=Brachionus plicatilis TaxID=10195 RepID=A0A3M7R5A8_BRAPC|nr:hypothetical protein BpHYR1_000179 [Brachionus plicatilis]